MPSVLLRGFPSTGPHDRSTRLLVLLSALLFLVFSFGTAHATRFVPVLTFAGLVQEADLVVRGQVIQKATFEAHMPFSDQNVEEVFTVYTLRITEVIKGKNTERKIRVFTWGGLLPNGEHHIWHDLNIEAEIGDPVAVMLNKSSANGNYWTPHHTLSFFDEKEVAGVTYLRPKEDGGYVHGELAGRRALFAERSRENGISLDELRSFVR